LTIHRSGQADLNWGQLVVFPTILVCSECGFTELTVQKEDLQRLFSQTDNRE